MDTVQNLINNVSKEAILEIKEDIINLYKLEIFTKQLYLAQLRKFEGQILITLTYLSQQEEMHSNAMKILLNKIDYKIEKEHDLINQTKKRLSLIDSLSFDVKQEEIAQVDYEKAINNSTNEPMKKLLTLLLEQEYEHLERLNNFVEENK